MLGSHQTPPNNSPIESSKQAIETIKPDLLVRPADQVRMWWNNSAGFMKRRKKWREWMDGKRTVLYSKYKKTHCCQEGRLRTGQCLDWCSVQPGRWPSGCPPASAPFLTHSWTETEKKRAKVTDMMRLILFLQWHSTLTNDFLHFHHSRWLGATVLSLFVHDRESACTWRPPPQTGAAHRGWMNGGLPTPPHFLWSANHTCIIMKPIFV